MNVSLIYGGPVALSLSFFGIYIVSGGHLSVE